MSEALEQDKELTLKVESQIENMRRYRESPNLESLMSGIEIKIGSDHVLIAIMKSVYSSDVSGLSRISSGFISEDVHARLSNATEQREISSGIIENVPITGPKAQDEEVVDPNQIQLQEKVSEALAELSLEDIKKLEESGSGVICLDNDIIAQIDFDDDKQSWAEFITERCQKSDSQKSAEIRGHGVFVSEDGLGFYNEESENPEEKEVLVKSQPNQSLDPNKSLKDMKNLGVPEFWVDPSPDLDAKNKEQTSQKRSSSFNFLRKAASNENVSSDNSDMAKLAASAATGTGIVAASAASSKQAAKGAAKGGLKYSPISPEVFLETGKVVGSNSTRLAGQVIVGVSAAFLAWDVIDLGWTVADLVRKKGSNAGKILKDKADELEEALRQTTESYSVEMMKD